jgi:hypothetical protein
MKSLKKTIIKATIQFHETYFRRIPLFIQCATIYDDKELSPDINLSLAPDCYDFSCTQKLCRYTFTNSFLQILRSLQQSNLQSLFWCVSYQSLSRSWRTNLDCGLFCLHDLEIRLTACVTGRQGMLTPPRHLNLWYIQRSVSASFSDVYFLQDLWDRWHDCSLFMPFHSYRS